MGLGPEHDLVLNAADAFWQSRLNRFNRRIEMPALGPWHTGPRRSSSLWKDPLAEARWNARGSALVIRRRVACRFGAAMQRVLPSIALVGAILTGSAHAIQQREVHAASVDTPDVVDMSHASPDTWHTLPPSKPAAQFPPSSEDEILTYLADLFLE